MAIGKAINFVRQIRDNDGLRRACNSCESKDVVMERQGFNEVEFEDAINMQLVKCQSYEEANVIQQIKMWFALL
jgi:hypothetical protein